MSISERLVGIIPNEKKTDSLMTFVFETSNSYIEAQKEEVGVSPYLTTEENNIIKEEMLKINDYLKGRIITFDVMQYVVTSTINKTIPIKFYKEIESNLFYYDEIAKASQSKMKSISKKERNNEGKEKWIPDLLMFCLLHDALDKGLPFNKYDFFLDYDFSKVFQIYRKVNKKLKKEDVVNKGNSFRHNTMINQMENLSITIIETLQKSKFRLKRHSTTKRRKRRR